MYLALYKVKCVKFTTFQTPCVQEDRGWQGHWTTGSRPSLWNEK